MIAMLPRNKVEGFQLTNKSGKRVGILNYGAIVTSIFAPDRNGELANIVLGFDAVEDYLASNTHYFGATIGRYANRIANSKLRLLNSLAAVEIHKISFDQRSVSACMRDGHPLFGSGQVPIIFGLRTKCQ